MNVSAKQITASVMGAVAAAFLASVLSQKGTIVGVAIGAAVATTATAVVGRSIERTHELVRTVVKEPAVPQLVRRFSANRALGDIGRGAGTSATSVEPGAATSALSATSGGPDRSPISSGRPHADGRRSPLRLRRSWQALMALTVVIFLAGVLVVTAIEAVAQQPLSTMVGSGHAHGLSFNNLVTGGSSPGPSTTVPATTSTTSGTSSTTIGPGSTTTTVGASTTTAPSASSTSTTPPTTVPTTTPGLTVP